LPVRILRWLIVATASACGVGALTAVSNAAIFAWGSSLSAGATADQAHPQGDLFIPIAVPGATTAAPSAGQVLSVKVKGIAVASTAPGAPPPMTAIHFQDVRPQPGGSYLIVTTSQAFNLPTSGDPNQVSTYAPTNLCVMAGDRVSVTTDGGFDPTFYPMGVDFRIFAPTPGAATAFFQSPSGSSNGEHITPTQLSNVETLMQITEGTGTNATPLCSASKPKKPTSKRHHKRRGGHHHH
jgi:hypothetical protein